MGNSLSFMKFKKEIMLIISQQQRRFVKICKDNDLSGFIEFSKERKEFNKITNFSDGFILVCEHKNKEFIKFFINNSVIFSSLDFEHIYSNLIASKNIEIMQLLELFEPINTIYIEKSIKQIALVGDIGLLEYFNKVHQLTPEQLNIFLNKACENGQLNLVDYLFNNFELDIHNNYDLPLRGAARERKLDVVKYLLTDNKLKEKANPHALNDDLYISAIMSQNKPVLDYLINDYKISESAAVKDYKKSKSSFA